MYHVMHQILQLHDLHIGHPVPSVDMQPKAASENGQAVRGKPQLQKTLCASFRD